MRTTKRYVLVIALTLTASTAVLITTTNAVGQTGPTVIRLIAPLNYVQFHATGVSAKGISPATASRKAGYRPTPPWRRDRTPSPSPLSGKPG